MRVQKRNPWLYSLGAVVAAMALWGSRAGADVASDRPGTIVMWPKVIADGTRDTLITLTNTGNQTAFAHCQYVNGIGVCRLSGAYCTIPSAESVSQPQCPGGEADVCDQFWLLQNFDVVLTRQQPTIWRVSTGRIDNPLIPADGRCELNPPLYLTQSCPGFFMGNTPNSPGQVLPVAPPFRGELRCVETTMDGTVWPGDDLKGEATLETVGEPIFPPPFGLRVRSAQISKYSSINVIAVQPPMNDPSILPLNGVNPARTEYNIFNACPEAIEFTNYSRGAEDLVAADIEPTACDSTGCPVTTEITLIPCRADFEGGMPTRFLADIRYTDEFESTLSVDLNATCWAQFTLENLGFQNPMGASTFQRTRINSTGVGICIAGDADRINQQCTADQNPGNPNLGCGVGGVCAPATGILGIVEEFHDTDLTLGPSPFIPGTNAANPVSVEDGDGIGSDGFIGKRGRCRGALTTRCTSDLDCPPGKCRVSGAACNNNVVPPVGCGPGDFCDQCMNDEIRFQPNVIMAPPMRP